MIATTNLQCFGDYKETLLASDEYLTIQFSPTTSPRQQRWRNYGLSADFLGDYFAAFFPGHVLSSQTINHKDAVKAAVSYVANELLENAVKFSDENARQPISISLFLYKEEIVFKVINYVNSQVASQYQAFIQELINSDIDDLYMRQLEKTATGSGQSNMGLLTMVNDYGAKLGWKFEAHSPQSHSSQSYSPQCPLVQVNVLVTLGV
jgi:hypothetical protein